MFCTRHLNTFWFLLFMIRLVVTNPCESARCWDFTLETVKVGRSIEVPLSTSGIDDVCFWNTTTSRWDRVCYFSSGVCRLLHSSFQEKIVIKKETLIFEDVTKAANGSYKVLKLDENCEAGINITVLASGSNPDGLRQQSIMAWLSCLIAIGVLGSLDFL